MKTISRLSVILLMTLFSSAIFAQQGQGMRNADPEESAKNQVNVMKEIIKIDSKEEAKVKEIFLSAAKEQQKAFSGNQPGGDREAMRAKMAEMNKKRDAELLKVLGKERMDKYTVEIEKRRAERAPARR
jgi:hypothetical protein